MNTEEILTVQRPGKTQPFRQCVVEAVSGYLQQIEEEQVCHLYRLVLSEMEQPLLETVMRHVNGNQSQASQLLGISRSTLRKKLSTYQIE